MAAISQNSDDSLARRNMWVLVAAQAILGAQMPIHFILGGLSGNVLAEDKCWATLPISLIVLGSMLSAPNIANVMQRFGRRTGFYLGALAGALGAGICAYALTVSSFYLFLLGSFVTGTYMAANGMYRFAAVDTASAAFRPKAISYVMAGGLLAALIGPQLVKVTENLLAPVPFAGAYIAVILLNLFGMAIFLFLRIPIPPKPQEGAPVGRSRLELLKSPPIVVAMICAMVAYALMNLVMTSTPLAVVACGFTTGNASDVVSAHVFAMFAPSFFTGHLIARFGAERIIAAGLVILCGAGVVGLSGVELENFFIALVLLGIGWNFGFIGGTALLAANHTPEERARAQGMNDFFVFGLVTIGSLASGGLMNCSGGTAIEGWNAVNYAMIPFIALAGGALLWFALSKRKPVMQ
jgi:MFS family permease